MRVAAIRNAIVCIAFGPTLLSSSFAGAQATAVTPAQEAQVRFEKGLALYERNEFEAALAEFALSRKIFPTRAATRDAVLCLRKLGRFDEALDLLEAALRDFPDAPATEKSAFQRDIEIVASQVGAIDVRGGEANATITIDGRDRKFGITRVTSGVHIVKVYAENFVPFEREVTVAGERIVAVQAELHPLIESGRLRIVEQHEGTLDVIVDGVVVGRTPWEWLAAASVLVVIARRRSRRARDVIYSSRQKTRSS